MPRSSSTTLLTVSADRTLRRLAPRVWVGGAPMRMFRVSDAGDELLARLASDEQISVNGEAAKRLLRRLVDAGAAHPVVDGVPSRFSGRDVTAVVAVRDNPDGIRSLGNLSASVEFVVVVDDGSGDPGAHSAAARDIGAKYVRLESSGGPGAARNAGAKLARTDLLAFVDSDVEVTTQWLVPLLAHFEDEAVEVVAPRVGTRDRGDPISAYEANSSPLDLGSEPANVRPGSMVSFVPAAALLVRSEAFAALGGFNPDLRFGEDVDFVWRVEADGGSIRYEPASEVMHLPRSTWAGLLRQRIDYGSSAAELAERHRGSVPPVVLSPWSAGVWLNVVAGHRFRALVIAASSGIALARKLDQVTPGVALRLVIAGHLGAGRQLAKAAVREWWPVLAVASLMSRQARRAALMAVAARVLGDGRPPAQRVIGIVDDMAYGAGVWKGVVRRRSVKALLPRITRR